MKAATVTLALLLGLLGAGSVCAQQLQLDEPISAGRVALFRSLDDANTYYYVPQRARLATHPNGLPQFSFLEYVQNVRSAADAPDAREGDGGGVVNATVELGITDAEREAAAQELRRLRPGARIAGAAAFRSGRFALISNFAEPGSDLTQHVLGVGAAPLLEGGRAGITLRLTKLGAQMLRESFNMATPDITFRFEMELSGYRAPISAVLEADFERIYQHRDVNAAVATPTMGAEIRDTFEDLRNSGAIKLEIVGNSEKLQEAIDFAYRKLTEIMFAPVGGTGTPTLESLQGAASGKPSLLDRATARLDAARKEVRESNAALRRERAEARAKRYEREAQEAAKAAGEIEQGALENQDREILALIEQYRAHREEMAQAAKKQLDSLPASDVADELPLEEPLPQFAAMAVYELRESRRSDKYRLDLSQTLPDVQPVNFVENIGDLRRHLGNDWVFRRVNLDDPLFKQREISAFVDGSNSKDFAEYINSVTLQLRKRHQNGEETLDEVRIDRQRFNAEANRFKLLYGWKGDDDRRLWERYQHRALWSFFGGQAVEEPWREAHFGTITLTPPYVRGFVTAEAFDPESLVRAGVRAITVTVFYQVAGAEKSARRVLRPAKGETAAELELILPRDSVDYEYQIDWLLQNNQSRSSGRKRGSSPVLSIDLGEE